MVHIIVLSLEIVIATATIAWIASLVLKDSSIADVFWGLFFVAIAAGLLFHNHQTTNVQLIDTALVALWGLRLAYHIGRRKIGKPEDWRYSALRERWGAWFPLRSYVQTFLLQGVLALIISGSTLVIAYSVTSSQSSSLGWWQWLAMLLWVIGFFFEAVGDLQLSRFIKTRSNKHEIMTSGLWRYSRHPNYFGEVTQWWALWILCVGYNYWLAAIVSPLLITYLILFVSGVPLLEKKHGSDPAYKEYNARTSIFIPMIPKKEAS